MTYFISFIKTQCIIIYIIKLTVVYQKYCLRREKEYHAFDINHSSPTVYECVKWHNKASSQVMCLHGTK